MEINYKVSYRNVKHPRLEFKTGELILVLPPGQAPEPILARHKKWIRSKVDFIGNVRDKVASNDIIQRDLDAFKSLVMLFVKRAESELNVKINKIYFRKMCTKWASMSINKNLMINTVASYLPDDLLEYLIFHELTHLYERRHNRRFWSLVKRKYKDYQELESRLFGYWFIVMGCNLMN